MKDAGSSATCGECHLFCDLPVRKHHSACVKGRVRKKKERLREGVASPY